MTTAYVLDLFGTSVFAVSGSLLAAQKKFDIFGFFIVSFFTAAGGGTFRDFILGRTPVFWLKDINYLLVVLISTIVTFILFDIIGKFKNLLRYADAVGLSVFTLIGINVALESNMSPFYAIVIGDITAVFGGIVRDLLCNEVPLIFSREIYATACIIGGIFFFILQHFNFSNSVIEIFVFFIIFVIRISSIHLNLSLPKK
jgi:uncharacterized membrane protein YeiH